MKPIYEIVKNKNYVGIQYEFCTVSGKYEPPHWHEELEILYYLNGTPEIMIEGKKCQLPKRQVVVINSGQVHNTFFGDLTAMYLSIHVDTKAMREYMPDNGEGMICCNPNKMKAENLERYREICILLEQITKLYMQNKEMCSLEITGLILQVYAQLVRNFSQKSRPDHREMNPLSRQRIQKIIEYTDRHYMEQITLDSMAEIIGVGKEYFCRIFKTNMGMSYGKYLSEVRAAKIHQDIVHTNEAVSCLMEKHGFLNAKLFYDTFKTIYGCTPLQLRNRKKKEQKDEEK